MHTLRALVGGAALCRVAAGAPTVAGAAPGPTPGAASTPVAAAPAVADRTFTINGRGWGHGVGLSQTGAGVMGQRGYDAGQILDFYYPTSTPAHLSDSPLRVRLSAADQTALQVAAATDLRVTGGDGAVLGLGTDVPAWRARRTGTNTFAIEALAAGAWQTRGALTGPVTFSRTGELTVQTVAKPTCRHQTTLTFAGQARTLESAGAQYSLAIVPMEEYLRGVISSEMPASYPAASLQAQTVAARSYSATQRITRAGNFYDVWDSTNDQCWDGRMAYATPTDAAIAATRQSVRTSGGRPIFSQFSASNGGWVAPGWGAPYLQAKADPFDDDPSNPYRTWTVELTGSRVAQALGMGSVGNLRVVATDGHGVGGGRVTQIAADGTTTAGAPTTVTVTGDRFRGLLGLRSNYLSVAPGDPSLVLEPGQATSSPGGAYTLVMQGDGNLVLYRQGGGAVWASQTYVPGLRLVVQGDGNAVLYGGNHPWWYMGTTAPGGRLAVQDDGNLVLYDYFNQAQWSSRYGPAPTRSNTPVTHLVPAQQAVTLDGGYRLILQGDGNLVIYDARGIPRWATNTYVAGARLVVQGDGNAVIVSPAGSPVWSTGTFRSPGARLLLQEDGNLVVYDSAGRPVWHR